MKTSNWQVRSTPVPGGEALTPEISAFRRYGSELRRYCHHYVREPQDMDDLAREVHVRLQSGDAQPAAAATETSFFGMPQAPAERAAQVVSARLEQGQLHLQQQLERALAEMSPVHAAVLLMHKRDGFSQEAIAIELQLGVPAVTKYLAEARTQLRMKLWK